MKEEIRNIAIIAHVDHGKTTLVDCLLKQSGLFRANQAIVREERILDMLDLEREKGITIKAKNASFRYGNVRINLVDTPGHADFASEVERTMNMIDGVILLVDAVEGPQAQTRFVLRKALEAGARPIVVINKIDREHADPERVLDQVLDLFLSLEASDEQLDFPVLYTSAKEGYTKRSMEDSSQDMRPLFEAIVQHIPPPRVESGEGFQLLVANLDWNDYVGRVAYGKIYYGTIRKGQTAVCLHGDGRVSHGKITALFRFEGLKPIEIEEAHAGDIVGVAGFSEVSIGETLADSEERGALTYIPVDPPTLQMQFAVNDGPLAGKEGSYVTATHLWERLVQECRINLAIRVEKTDDPKIFRVLARGYMQIAILLEQMRREGYEVLVSRPEPVLKQDEQGRILEPIEELYVEIPQEMLGPVLEVLSQRKTNILDMNPQGDRVTIRGLIPMRGLIGFETELVTLTRGQGIMSHLFHGYAPYQGEIQTRRCGVQISIEDGVATSYALNQLQERGRLFIGPGERVYKGMIIGEHTRGNDLPVNPCRTKHLTNMRSKGEGVGILLEPPLRMNIERALEFIAPDEYVEVTPKTIRLRKRILDETERKREARRREAQLV